MTAWSCPLTLTIFISFVASIPASSLSVEIGNVYPAVDVTSCNAIFFPFKSFKLLMPESFLTNISDL